MEQIDSLIKREIAVYLQRHFPDDFIVLTEVHVTKDLSHAKIWVSSPLDPERSAKNCQASAKEIRKYLAGKIVARKVPALYFVPDLTQEHVDKIERLIKKTKE